MAWTAEDILGDREEETARKEALELERQQDELARKRKDIQREIADLKRQDEDLEDEEIETAGLLATIMSMLGLS